MDKRTHGWDAQISNRNLADANCVATICLQSLNLPPVKWALTNLALTLNSALKEDLGTISRCDKSLPKNITDLVKFCQT